MRGSEKGKGLSLGAEITTDNTLVPQRSEVVILAVKPHIIPSVLQDIHPFVGDKNLILSVAMGIPLRDIEKGLPTGTRVVRIMPNTPAVVRSAASVYVCGNATKSKDEAVTEKLLRAIGTCDKVAESMMDAITALSGAGPAYAYIMVEALADGGVKMGLPRDLSYRLAAQTVLGAGQMIRDTRIHPGQLKDDVTSPGGCTIAGLHYLENHGFRAALIGAVEQATKKAEEVALAQTR
uniref:Pyrroline-5-carboxylate reductase n=1 Tax=Timema cristinae TaxID=61476 RepID=A0A7R9CCW3_TIMCR|nr:unnamed protein product [Timema cristinae]